PILNEFDNYLKRESGYARSSIAVSPRGGSTGQPVQHFLRLAPLRPTPAAPDMELAFSQELLAAGAESRWDAVQAVWLTDGPEPAILVANGKEVRQVNTAAPALAFPGGPKAVPPTTAGVLAIDWNNDYRTDLLLAGAGGLRFFQQSADGKFT